LNNVREIRPRHFDSFSQAAAENAASRIFLGIHWRFDAVAGVDAGNRIADYAFDHILRPRTGRAPVHVATAEFESQIDAYLNNTYSTTPQAVASEIIAIIVAPGKFSEQKMAQVASPLTHQVMSEMLHHVGQFKSLVSQIDVLAQGNQRQFRPTLLRLEAKLRDLVFAQRDLFERMTPAIT
jgi:hypothetical protein